MSHIAKRRLWVLMTVQVLLIAHVVLWWLSTKYGWFGGWTLTPIEPSEELEEQAQPFVLTSDSGKYMVLHRVNEVAPQECISWLKENGQNSFEKILQSIHFEPAKQGQDLWAPVDSETSKRFVHNFFND